MSIAILNKVSHKNNPYENWLSDLNEDIVMLTSRETSFGHPKERYSHVEIFDDYIDSSEVENRLIELDKLYHFREIIVLSEYDIIRAGRLRDILNLEGQSYFSAESFRNKILMKQLANKSNINTPQFSRIKGVKDIYNFVGEFGYPLVIKPIYGSGSEDTHIISDNNDISNFINVYSEVLKDFEIETFVEGEMYHVDGLIVGGEIYFSCVSKYYLDCLAFKEGKAVSSYLLEESNWIKDELLKATTKLLAGLPTPLNTAFHAEFFHSKSDEIILCEIASRSGGGEIINVINKTYKIHLNESLVRSICGLEVKKPVIPKEKLGGFSLIPPKKGIFKGYKTNIDYPWIQEVKYHAEIGKKYDDAQHSVEQIAAVIVAGDTEQELRYRIDKINLWFEENAIWDPLT